MDEFDEFIAGNFLGCGTSAVGECDFDLEGGSALDGWGSGDSIVEFAGDDGFESFVEEFATDGNDAVGRRRSDFGFLQRVVESFGFGLSDFDCACSGGDFGDFADFSSDGGGDAGEGVGEEGGNGGGFIATEHGDESSEFDAVGVGFNFFGFSGKFGGRAVDGTLFAVGAMPMDRDVWVGDGCLFEVFIDASAASFVNTGKFDGHAGT